MNARFLLRYPGRALQGAALVASFVANGMAAAQSVWTASDLSSSGQVYSVARGDAEFVAVTGAGEIFRSADGASWSNSLASGGAFLQGVGSAAGAFLAVGASGTILRSTDAITWDGQTTPTTAFLDAVVAVGKSAYVVGGGGTILTSADGQSWSSVSSGSSAFLSGVAFGAGRIVSVGSGGAVIVSDDGQTWSPATSGTANFLSDIDYSDGLFVAVGQAGTIITSDDGSTWAARSSGTIQWLFDVTHGNGEFVAVGDGGTVLRSADAVTWTAATSGTSTDLNAAAFGAGTFVAGGAGGASRSSPAAPPLPRISFALGDVLFEEGSGGGNLLLEINRSGDLATAASVSAAAFGIEAESGTDFTLGAVPVNFDSGQALATLSVAIPDDGLLETIETFVVELRSPSAGNALGETASVCVRIHDPGDSDGDFLPDSWELANFSDLTSNSAGDDPDSDGNDNLREFEDGTAPTSAASVRYRVFVSGPGASFFFFPDEPSYEPGSLVAVGAAEDSGFTFLRWEGDVQGDPTDNPLTVLTNSDIELLCVLTTSLENALDLSGVSWSTTGAALWTGQTKTTDDGTDAAQAGAIGAGGVSELFTTVSGPGTLSFRWRSMFDEPGDLGRVFLNGAAVASIAGETAWTTREIALPAGDSELRFVFQRGAAASPGDGFWVDSVQFSPAPADSYAAWRAAEFTAAEAADDAVSGPGADPDGDGVENAAEYLLGLLPKEADSGLVAHSLAPVAGGVEISITVLKSRLPYVGLTLEGSGDLEIWTDLGLPFATIAETATHATLAAEHSAASLQRQFYRIGIDLVPAP